MLQGCRARSSVIVEDLIDNSLRCKVQCQGCVLQSEQYLGSEELQDCDPGPGVVVEKLEPAWCRYYNVSLLQCDGAHRAVPDQTYPGVTVQHTGVEVKPLHHACSASLQNPEDAGRKKKDGSGETREGRSEELMRRTNRMENAETPRRTKAAEARRQWRRRRKFEGDNRELSRGLRIRKSEMETTRQRRPGSSRSVDPPGTSHELGRGREGK
ncbi:hypothetical protein NDU88_010416 [Pleurodeles waltl]|uniref:Uncharacterized protein n=1 Tax=Pleurodeles waltl TaxID=8319 RepID=A0AAV7RY63_PLEWA|nr:hypothetical protein NDU88_010416 [Pleurodeles waltl]